MNTRLSMIETPLKTDTLDDYRPDMKANKPNPNQRSN